MTLADISIGIRGAILVSIKALPNLDVHLEKTRGYDRSTQIC
jgi:hypothetical protein